tara:strand:- start:121 stop:378 length:258 start_codon:yes stop_codon:yes gene_type:complete
MSDPQQLSEEYIRGGIDSLITVLWAIQPLIGNDPEMHKKFHATIYKDWEEIFGMTKEEVDKQLDDALGATEPMRYGPDPPDADVW